MFSGKLRLSLVAILAAFSWSSLVLAVPVGNPVVQHDYFAATGVEDLAVGNRDGILGSAATLVAPSGETPGYVNLPGGSDSQVILPTKENNDLVNGESLSSVSELAGGDASVEIWIDFDSTNTLGSEDGNSRFNIFQAWSIHGSYATLYFDNRQPDAPEHVVGGSKDSDIINGAYRGGDAMRSKMEGLHQWVWAFDGNQPSGDGTWTIFRDGQPMVGDPISTLDGRLSNDVYKTGPGGANMFTLAGLGEFAVGGVVPMGSSAPVYGTGPIGKLYRTLIYDTALSAEDVNANYLDGMDQFGGGTPVEGVVGDYNANGIVDAADFTVWQDNWATGFALPNEDPSASPGSVTNEDYDVWVANFNNGAAAGSGSGGAPVPEPGGLALLFLAAIGTAFCRRNRCF